MDVGGTSMIIKPEILEDEIKLVFTFCFYYNHPVFPLFSIFLYGFITF